jgi:hypothetical protein
MPGGFHPFHAGHFALYQSAKKAFPNADVYVAATNDTSERPFPFSLKEKLAKLAGIAPGKFIQVKSPFQVREITDHYDPEKDVLIFVRSEKDRNESPKPGGIKKDGTPSYFQPWTGKDVQPFGKHAYFEYLPTVEFGPGITSATQIRKAWPTLNDKRKLAMVMSLYPVTQKNSKLAQTVVGMFDQVMGEELEEARANTAGARAGLSKRKETKPLSAEEQAAKDKAKADKWLEKERAKMAAKKGVAEDDVWGPQGNFAGDKPVELGNVTMKQIQVGDMVMYIDQKAKVLAMSRDRKHSRINIQTGIGGITKDVLTSDLKQLGQGVVNEFAIDKPDDGDGRSKLISSIVRLLQAGNKVDFFVPGIRGHVVGTGSNGQSLTLKRWKKPYSKVNYSLDLDSSDDNRFVLKMINPDYYQVVEKQDLNEFAPDDGGDSRVPMHFVVEKELYNPRSKWKKSYNPGGGGVLLFTTKEEAIQAAEKFNRLDKNREFKYGGTQMADTDLDEGIFGGLGGPASGPMLARGGPGYAGLSGAKKLRHDAYVELQMVDSLKHTNHNGRYDEEIKKKLLQAKEYLAKAKEIEQGLAEARFDKEAFRQQMKDLEAREELRKTDPVSAKALDLRDKLPQQSKKKPDDDSIGVNDPRHPGYAYTQAGQHKLDEFAPDDGDESRKFIPWNEFVDQLKQILHKDFDCKESINMDVIKAKFVPYDPMEYGPTMLYSYYERRAGRKGANGVRGQIQVGNFFKGSKPGDNQLMTGFHLLKGTEFERYFDLTFDNLYKIARIIQGNTQGRLESQQGVAEAGSEEINEGSQIERKIARVQSMIQDYYNRAKATKNDIKKNHYIQMADQLQSELDRLINDSNEMERDGNMVAQHDDEPSNTWNRGGLAEDYLDEK